MDRKLPKEHPNPINHNTVKKKLGKTYLKSFFHFKFVIIRKTIIVSSIDLTNEY